MSRADQDRYFAESGEIARLLDADPVPRDPGGGRAADRRISRRSFAPTTARRAFRDFVLKAPHAVCGSAGSGAADERGGRPDAAVRPADARPFAAPATADGARRDTWHRADLSWAFAGEHYRRRIELRRRPAAWQSDADTKESFTCR